MTDKPENPEEVKPSVCQACAGTGFSDRVHRGAFTMTPTDKVCPECKGSGWLNRRLDAIAKAEGKET